MASIPYVVPFLVFLGFLGLRSLAALPALAEQVVWFGVMAVVIALVARPALDFRVRMPVGTVLLGIGVFVLWIAPDYLFPGYRSHWLFTNSVFGEVNPGLAEADRSSFAILTLRTMRAALIVPIVEELFWRGWLMRWLIDPDFQKVPLGAYSAQAFWIVALLFASEHGPYWDVGLAAGVLYNWWMLRTKSLGDLILAHAVTNACLSAYVIAAGKWEFW